MTTQWETVRIFISSTFEDMHAERDYLVKQVFPELREWCELRKLNLVDIDLRWGVKEEDTKNKNVVDVCMKRIDDARPFFICLLGQRRGWVPQRDDISSSTLAPNSFPDLEKVIGTTSVTEMEIIHALINPFHRSRQTKEHGPEYYDPVEHAFFYLRDPSYLQDIPEDFQDHRQIFTNEALPLDERKLADSVLQKWREIEIPELCSKKQIPLHKYQTRWNSDAISPELIWPIQCPSLVPENQKRWKNRWIDVGVQVSGDQIVDPREIEKAQVFNKKRSTGRLDNFLVDNVSLKEVVLADLKKAIMARYPTHMEAIQSSELQKELDQQEQFLQVCKEGFIERGNDFQYLDEYIQGDSKQVFVLTAQGGMGKSTLLANWLDRLENQIGASSKTTIHYRFIGQSDRSSNVDSLLSLLLGEIKETTGKLTEPLPGNPAMLRQDFGKYLANIGQNGKTIIVLDAINQLEGRLSDLAWLPWQLPENIKIIISLKRGDFDTETLISQKTGQIILNELKAFSNLNDRRQLVKTYLSQYLKDLDEVYIHALIQSEGAENPLFLKIALSELRVFGAFANLGEKIKNDFGSTPFSAFNAVLKRLEEDPASTTINPGQAVPLIFGVLAYARKGLSAGELTEILIRSMGLEPNTTIREEVCNTVFHFLRQVRPFMAHRDGRFDYFYETFQLAVLERYKHLFSIKDWHGKLADYFAALPTWLDEDKNNPTVRKVSEYPYHLAMAARSQEFTTILTQFDFLKAKVMSLGAVLLLDDLKLRKLPSLHLAESTLKDMTLIERAIILSLHNLNADPDQFAEQLYARLGDQDQPMIQDLLIQANSWMKKTWLKPVTYRFNKPESELQNSFKTTNHYIVNAIPTSDGNTILILGTESNAPQLTLKRIDAKTGNVIQQVQVDGNITHADIQLTSDGRKILMVSRLLLSIFDAESLNCLKNIPINGSYGKNSCFLRISPDNVFAFVIDQKKLTQIRLQDGERVRRFDLIGDIQAFYFSASGKFAGYCLGGDRFVDTHGSFSKENYIQYNRNDTLFFLNLSDYSPPIMVTNNALCDDFIFSNDETHFICVSEIGRIEVWNFHTNAMVQSLQALTDQQYDGVIQGLRYSGEMHSGLAKIVKVSDGNKAFCSFASAYLAVLNVEKAHAILLERNLYSSGQVINLKSGTGKVSISVSIMNEIILWDMETGSVIRRLKDSSKVRDAWLSTQGGKSQLISRNEENLFRTWEIQNSEISSPKPGIPAQARSSRLFSMKKHPAEANICVETTMTVQLYSVSSKNMIMEISSAGASPLRNLEYHPDGKKLFLEYLDGTIKIISLLNYQVEHLLRLDQLKNTLNEISLSSDGNLVIYSDGLELFNVKNLVDEKEYSFEGTFQLDQAMLPPNEDVIARTRLTPPGSPGWGRSKIIILPDTQHLVSFVYLPFIHKPYKGHPGTLEHVESRIEIHDVVTRKFIKRLELKNHHQPVILKQIVSKISQELYLLLADTDSSNFNSEFSYSITAVSKDLALNKDISIRKVRILDFDISEGGEFLCLVTADGYLEFISGASGELFARFRGDYVFTHCAMLENGRTICVGDEHGYVNFLQVENIPFN